MKCLKYFFTKRKINFRLFINKIRKLILKIVCVSNTNFWPSKIKMMTMGGHWGREGHLLTPFWTYPLFSTKIIRNQMIDLRGLEWKRAFSLFEEMSSNLKNGWAEETKTGVVGARAWIRRISLFNGGNKGGKGGNNRNF